MPSCLVFWASSKGSSDIWSDESTIRRFFESHLPLTSVPNARASAVFGFLPSPLHLWGIKNCGTKGWVWRLHPICLHRWRQKKVNSFTHKSQIVKQLGVNVKGEGKNCELVEGAMRGRVSAEAHLHTRGGTVRRSETREEGKGGENRRPARKRWEERKKRRRVSQESTQVFISTYHKKREKQKYTRETMDIRNKRFIFALDKTQLSLFPAALRRPYSAKSWGYPDESAQVLFDLLKKW